MCKDIVYRLYLIQAVSDFVLQDAQIYRLYLIRAVSDFVLQDVQI